MGITRGLDNISIPLGNWEEVLAKWRIGLVQVLLESTPIIDGTKTPPRTLTQTVSMTIARVSDATPATSTANSSGTKQLNSSKSEHQVRQLISLTITCGQSATAVALQARCARILPEPVSSRSAAYGATFFRCAPAATGPGLLHAEVPELLGEG